MELEYRWKEEVKFPRELTLRSSMKPGHVKLIRKLNKDYAIRLNLSDENGPKHMTEWINKYITDLKSEPNIQHDLFSLPPAFTYTPTKDNIALVNKTQASSIYDEYNHLVNVDDHMCQIIRLNHEKLAAPLTKEELEIARKDLLKYNQAFADREKDTMMKALNDPLRQHRIGALQDRQRRLKEEIKKYATNHKDVHKEVEEFAMKQREYKLLYNEIIRFAEQKYGKQA